MVRRTVFILLATLSLFLTNASGQTTSASLSGYAKDQAGDAIARAHLVLRNTGSGVTRTTITDELGRYVFTAVNPGSYDLHVEKSGFKTTVINHVELVVGGSAIINVLLSVGDVNEQVVVESELPLVSPDRSGIGRVVDSREIEDLPVGGRNFVDFVKLSSGVVLGRENVGGGSFKEPDAGVGASSVPRLSFGGQSELNTLVQVDGLDNVQTLTGLPRASPSMEAVREFRILNNTFLAEYGRALGGFVNIVTKSGDREEHGSFYYFGENQFLNARPILSPRLPVLRQNQYGLTFSGPLANDRTFYFFNYEGQRRVESNKFSQVILSNLAAINATRVAFGLRPEVDDLLRSTNYDQFLIKVDHHFHNGDGLTVRYNLQNAAVKGFLGGGGRASPASTTARNSGSIDQTVAINYVFLLSDRWVNEFRFQWARRSYSFSSVLKEPALEIPNLIIMGKSSSDMDSYAESRGQFADDLSIISGKHQFKLGFDYNDLRDHTTWGLFFPARIIFPNLDAFLAFRPTSTTGPVNFWWPQLTTASTHPGFAVPFTRDVPQDWVPATIFNLNHRSYGMFVQDEWKINQRWNFNYGLRYDFETYPARYILSNDLNNFQPRIGVAYGYNNRGVVRAGIGIFHDRIGSSVGQVFAIPEWNSRGDLPNATTLFSNVATFPGRFRQINALGPEAPPATINFLLTGRLPATGVSSLAGSLDSHLRTPYSEQAGVQISQEIGGIALSVSYLFVHSRKLIGQTPNLNAYQTGTLLTGKALLAGRYFTDLGNFIVISNIGDSIYNGGTIEIEKRFGRGIAFHSSYTFSKTLSDVDSAVSVADIPEGLKFDRALSRQHVANRYTLSLLSQAPRSFGVLRDFKLALLMTLESGRPYTIFVGRDANADGNPNSDRPGLLGRNSLLGPGFAAIDLRVARKLHVRNRWNAEFSLDFFNLLNRVNVRDLNTVYGSIDLNQPPSPSLGYRTPRDAYNPRKVQYGVKLLF